MGLKDKLLGQSDQSASIDYVNLDSAPYQPKAGASNLTVHVATIFDRSDVEAIKDAVYDGDMVIADITRFRTTGTTVEQVIDDLKALVREVDGDIAQKGDDQIIITPRDVGISREKIGN